MTTALESRPDLSTADLTTLYHLGVQVDALRDATRSLLAGPLTGPDTAGTVIERYSRLREHIAAAVPERQRDAMLSWVPTLSDSDSLEVAFLAASSLASYTDTVLGETGFVTSYRVRERQIEDARSELGPVPSAPGAAGLGDGGKLTTGPGQYL